MDKNDFERSMGHLMQQFQIEPSEKVWNAVEEKIGSRHKRRFLWWILPIAFLSIGGIWYGIDAPKNLPKPSTTSTTDIDQPEARSIDENVATLALSEPKPSDNSDSTILDAFKKVETKKRNHKQERYLAKHTCPVVLTTDQWNEVYTNYALAANEEDDISNTISIDQTTPSLLDTIVVVRNIERDQDSSSTPIRKPMVAKPAELKFSGYYSFHGTGDLEGTVLEVGSEKLIKKGLTFYTGLGVSIHSGNNDILGSSALPQLNSISQQSRTLTFGIQAAPGFFFYTKKERFKIGLSSVVRYQTTSNSGFSIRYVGTPVQPQYRFYNDNLTTFSLGYRVNLGLLIYDNPKHKLNLELLFQNDTNGDVLTGFGLTFSTKYKKQ